MQPRCSDSYLGESHGQCPEAGPRVQQKSIVIILGAGFSLGAGQPLTRDIFRIAERSINPRLFKELDKYLQTRGYTHNSLTTLSEDIEDVIIRVRQDAMAVPIPVYAHYISTPAHVYEEPFVEGGFITGAAQLRWAAEEPARSQEVYSPTTAFRTLMLLYWVLVSDRYEPHPYEGRFPEVPIDHGMPTVYRAFGSALPRGTCIITTNYDDILERALLSSQRAWTYGAEVLYPEELAEIPFQLGNGTHCIRDPNYEPSFGSRQLIWARQDWRPPATTTSADILVCRLHGSFRWVQCRNCNRFYSVDWWAAHPTGAFVGTFVPEDSNLTFACWNGECSFIPLMGVLLPNPTKVVPDEFSIVNDQWQTARDAAEGCETLVIVGSSLRETDRILCDLVRSAASSAKQIVLVDPSPRAAERAEALIGGPVDHADSLDSLLAAQIFSAHP